MQPEHHKERGGSLRGWLVAWCGARVGVSVCDLYTLATTTTTRVPTASPPFGPFRSL